MARERTEKRRFFRAKLPMVVWDPRNDSPLCDFSEGHIITDDKYTIKRLLEIGYPEIELDAVRPPEIVEPIQPEKMPDVRPLPAGLKEKGAVKLAETKGTIPESPAAGVIKPKNTPSNSPKKTPGKKVIKRRNK